MRPFGRGGGSGLNTIVVVMGLPLLIFVVDFGLRIMDGSIRTGGLDDSTYNMLRLGCTALLTLIAAQTLWYRSRLMASIMGIAVGLSAMWYIGYLKTIYLCKIGVVCL